MSAGSETHCCQPVEALAAHAGRQHRDAAAAEDAGDGDAAAAVVAGRWPHRAVVRRIELSGDQARHQAGIGGEHLVRADHREAAAEQHDDRRLHAGQLLAAARRGRARSTRSVPPVGVVEPVHAPQVFRARLVGVDSRRGRQHRRWRCAPGSASSLQRRQPSRARRAAARPRRAGARRIDNVGLHERRGCHFIAPQRARRL